MNWECAKVKSPKNLILDLKALQFESFGKLIPKN